MISSLFLSLGSAFQRAFSMDIRSLAAARVCLAIAILADLEQKSRFLTTFYTDEGILPRTAIINFFHQPLFFSVHMASGEAWFQMVLFALAAVLALMLLFGYKTRTVTIISWFLLCSLQARNLPILNAGDGILRLLVFWAMFLPMGATWSVDRAMHTGEAPRERVFSVGTLGWILQILLIYWVTVALRQSPEWLQEGSALYYALHIDQLTTGIGQWLSQQPLGVLQFLTWSAVAIEAGAPLLLLIPDRRGMARFLGCVLGISFHFGIFVMMHIGVFPFICMISWIALLPGGFWDFLTTRTGKGLTMYFDPDCGFCKKTVHLLRTFLGLRDAAIAPASGDILTVMEQENSWVVVTPEGRQHLKWQGMIACLHYSPLLFWLAPLAAWRPLRAVGEAIYRWVANHRSAMSVTTRPLTFQRARWQLGVLGSTVCAVCIGLMFAWNAQVLKMVPSLPEPVHAAVLLTRLDQYWNMFAPFPLKDDGWYVVPGTLLNGKTIDLLHGDKEGTVRFEKPADLATSFPTESWRKYFLNLWLQDFEKYREFYAEYHCRRWNTTHTGDERLKTLYIHFMKETTPPPMLRGTEKPEQLTIWEWHCGGVE